MIQSFPEALASLIPWLLAFVAVVTLLVAGIVAIYGYKKQEAGAKTKGSTRSSYGQVRRIAILIASKDGEKTIRPTVRAAKGSGRKVFVVSDGSTDRTAAEAKKSGAAVLALRKNIGKPGALLRAYRHFDLSRRFDAVAILDDDVLIAKDFITNAKKAMRQDVAISVGKNITNWPDAKRWNVWLAARAYSYWCYQLTLRRIQSAINVMNCISGSNSLYRTEVLDQVLSSKTPYIVDDTFWTLETHRLQLGRIVYAPRAYAWIQDPTSFKDWYKQNLRWMWGTFQGVIGHRIGSEFNRFHITYVLLIAEWVMYVLSGPVCIWLIAQGGWDNLPKQLAVLASGYALWVIGAAVSLRRPRLVLFIPMIVIVDFIFRALMLHAFVKAVRQKTVQSCVWNSPRRFDTRENATL